MEKVTTIYTHFANSLDVWWGNPEDEEAAEETGDEVILKKDKSGRVIGFEKLNYLSPKATDSGEQMTRLPVQVVMAEINNASCANFFITIDSFASGEKGRRACCSRSSSTGG
jgi:hypothetical protein